MPGCPIPSDWDGSTLKCYKVYWPSSRSYESVLLGQLSEPQKSRFWDEDTGDVVEAIAAIVEAENLTLPEFYLEDCEPVLPPVSAFKAALINDQTLPANGDWAKLGVTSPVSYDVNDTGWSSINNAHFPNTVEKNNGLWRYTAVARMAVGKTGSIRIATTAGGVLAVAKGNLQRLWLSVDYLWQGETIGIQLDGQIDGGGTIFSGSGSTHFSAVYLGPAD